MDLWVILTEQLMTHLRMLQEVGTSDPACSPHSSSLGYSTMVSPVLIADRAAVGHADEPVLYVIILSAALDLVGADTPKGVVAFFNIFPALLAKVGWPLISNGKIRYGRRVAFCTTVSWLGIVVSIVCPAQPSCQPEP
jgi:hypothetical protein